MTRIPNPPRVKTSLRDWGNRIARPIGEHPEVPMHSYTQEQFDGARGRDLYMLSGRATFTDTGHAQAMELADGAPVICYVNVLHCFLPDTYVDSPWPLREAEGELYSGTHLLADDGTPSVRWHASNPAWNSYHQDPDKVDPAQVAQMILGMVERYPVRGLFLDYLAEMPWTYPDDPTLTLADGGLQWRAYQVRLVWELKRRRPDLLLIANGPWAIAERGWQRAGFVDGTYWEAMGSVWYKPPAVIHELGQRKAEGIDLTWNLYNWEKRGSHAGSWDLRTVAGVLGRSVGGHVEDDYLKPAEALEP